MCWTTVRRWKDRIKATTVRAAVERKKVSNTRCWIKKTANLMPFWHKWFRSLRTFSSFEFMYFISCNKWIIYQVHFFRINFVFFLFLLSVFYTIGSTVRFDVRRRANRVFLIFIHNISYEFPKIVFSGVECVSNGQKKKRFISWEMVVSKGDPAYP